MYTLPHLGHMASFLSGGETHPRPNLRWTPSCTLLSLLCVGSDLETMEVEEPDDGSFALPAAVIQQHQEIATAAEGGMM